jgi:hypothetical protein
MDIRTAQRIDGLLANETFPSFINPADYCQTMELKMVELQELSRKGDKRAFEKCAFEIAAIAINFLESGVLSP